MSRVQLAINVAGRELLRAAGIAGDLPPTADGVDADVQELFGWVLREGLTNVARHSHARACRVRISPSSVEIVDDGVGGGAHFGNGLSGLRERVEAAGATLEAGTVRPQGWRLRVSVHGPGRTSGKPDAPTVDGCDPLGTSA